MNYERLTIRKILLIGSALVLLLSLVFLYEFIRFNDGKLHVVFCNVGQGDGIFIRTSKGLDVLIDGGPDDSVLSCLSKHMPFWDRTIELIFLTHPHADHMRGLVSVFKRYKVLSFATEKLSNDTVLYKEILEQVKSEKLKMKNLQQGDRFKTRDGVMFKILGPSEEFIERTSPTGKIGESREFGSLITLVSFGSFDVLLTGDSQSAGLKEALADNFSIEILQVPHHGSRFGLDREIAELLKPHTAIISVGKNNYGHPSKEVIKILRDLELKILRTDEHGDIEIEIDSKGKFSVQNLSH